MQSLFHLKNYKPESKTNSVCVKQEQEQRSEEETPLPSCSFAVGGGEGLTSCLPKGEGAVVEGQQPHSDLISAPWCVG